MRHNAFQEIDFFLNKIAHNIKKQTNSLNNLGLENGKMGIAIFFYLYSRYKNKKEFEYIADNLTDDVCVNINKITSVNFSNGLLGIAWGLEYLIKNRFAEADSDELLNSIDQIAYNTINYINIENNEDIFGHGLYLLSRYHSKVRMNNDIYKKDITDGINELLLKCEKFFIKNIFLCYYVPNVNICMLNSLLYFLLSISYIGIEHVRIKKIMTYILPSVELVKVSKTNPLNCAIMIQLIEMLYVNKIINSTQMACVLNKFRPNVNYLNYKLEMKNFIFSNSSPFVQIWIQFDYSDITKIYNKYYKNSECDSTILENKELTGIGISLLNNLTKL